MSSACVCHLHKEEKSAFCWVSRHLSQPSKEAADAVIGYGMCLFIRNLTELQAIFKAIFFGLFSSAWEDEWTHVQKVKLRQMKTFVQM